MNRYTIGHRFYDRKDISFSFTAKNKFVDDAAESLVIVKVDDNDESIAEQIHNKICAEVYKIKTEEIQDDTTNVMAFLTKIPRPLLKIVTKLLLLWITMINCQKLFWMLTLIEQLPYF